MLAARPPDIRGSLRQLYTNPLLYPKHPAKTSTPRNAGLAAKAGHPGRTGGLGPNPLRATKRSFVDDRPLGALQCARRPTVVFSQGHCRIRHEAGRRQLGDELVVGQEALWLA